MTCKESKFISTIGVKAYNWGLNNNQPNEEDKLLELKFIHQYG